MLWQNFSYQSIEYRTKPCERVWHTQNSQPWMSFLLMCWVDLDPETDQDLIIYLWHGRWYDVSYVCYLSRTLTFMGNLRTESHWAPCPSDSVNGVLSCTPRLWPEELNSAVTYSEDGRRFPFKLLFRSENTPSSWFTLNDICKHTHFFGHFQHHCICTYIFWKKKAL